MPTLDEHAETRVVKLLNVGDSKSGKTGSLASLARAGYNLYILDYDNGLDILVNLLHDDRDTLKRIQYEALRDTIVTQNGLPRLKPLIHAYKDAGRVLQAWGAENFTPADVLVLDSLTTFSEAAFNEALMLSGRLNQRPLLQDYGWLADSVKLFIEMITDPSLNCHVIVSSHIRYFAADEESQTQARGLPNAKGQEISRIVSRYFNSVVLTRSMGTGAATRRLITTKPQGVVEVATSNPKTKDSYPVETGMAQLFKDLLGGQEPQGPPAPQEAKSTTTATTLQPTG